MGDLVSLLVVTGYVNEGKSRYNLRFKYIPDCISYFVKNIKKFSSKKKLQNTNAIKKTLGLIQLKFRVFTARKQLKCWDLSCALD